MLAWVLSSVLSTAAVMHCRLLWLYIKNTRRVLLYSISLAILYIPSLAVLIWLLRIPPRTFGLTTVGILIIFHTQHVANYLYQRSAITKYPREFAVFWCLIAISLIGCFILLSPNVPTKPIMSPWWLILTIALIAIGTKYIIGSHSSARISEIESSRLLQQPNLDMYFNLLKKVNALEEYYLIRTFNPKFKTKGRRPVLTPGICQQLRSQKDPKKLPNLGRLIYDEKIKDFKILPNYSGYIAKVNDSEIDIALRGTQNLSQMARNLGGSTPVYSTNDGLYKHAQMNSSAHKIMNEIQPILEKSRKVPINITGHSRGATIGFYLTQLIARQSDKNRKIRLVMFAPPPVIDPKAQDWLDQHKNVDAHTIYTQKDNMLLAHEYLPDTIATLGDLTILDKTPESIPPPFCYLTYAKNNKWKSDSFSKFKPQWFPHRLDYYYTALSDAINKKKAAPAAA